MNKSERFLESIIPLVGFVVFILVMLVSDTPVWPFILSIVSMLITYNIFSNEGNTRIEGDLVNKEFSEEREIIKNYEYFFKDNFSPPLTENQKIAVVVDRGNNLIISGAGTGKTTTIIAKILFLLKSKNSRQDEMLVIVFTNSAGDELRERLNEKIGKNRIEISTLHAFGKKIIQAVEHKKTHTASFLNEQNNTYRYIEKIIIDLCSENNTFKKNFVDFFIYEKIENLDGTFRNENEYLMYLNSNPNVTLQGEFVKSFGELSIANFLYKNSIPYKYEDIYKQHTDDSHKPDFHILNSNIWIEYFGIDKYGNTRKDIPNIKYKNEMEWKKDRHIANNTEMIEIFFSDFQEKNWEKKLEKKLLDLNIKLIEKSTDEIYKNLSKIELTGYSKLVTRFLDLDKAKLKKKIPINSRQENFLKLYEEIRRKYEDSLGDEIDFNDMINKASEYLKNHKYYHKFNYVIVDEFQDVSMSDCNFIKKLLVSRYELTELDNQQEIKLYCVGDDWQSIYGFRGAEPSIMRDFNRHFNEKSINSSSVRLDRTFRFDNIINDVSSRFLMKNPNQIRKKLLPHKTTNKPSVFLHYVEPKSIEESVREWIIKYSTHDEYKMKNLLILDRYDIYKRYKPDQKKMVKEFLDEFKKLWGNGRKVRYKTLHSSKGNQEDIVLIVGIEGSSKNTKKSFPSEYKVDEILSMVLEKYDDFTFSDERRLLYVGMTRAKYQLHLLCNYINTSPFLNELKRYPDIKIIEADSFKNRICPLCKKGSIRNVKNDKNSMPFYLCNREPVCKYVGCSCQEKGCKGLVVRKNDKGVCNNNKCRHEYNACKGCESGILIKRYDSSDEPFFGCHTFSIPSLRCKYTQS